MLSLYRDALRIRRSHPVLSGTGSEVDWLDMGQEVIGFRRQSSFTCIVNLGASDVELPPGEVVLSSVPVADTIPSDATVWLDTNDPLN